MSKIFTKIGPQFGVNVVQLLNKECSTRSLCNVAKVAKPCKKEVKSNLFLRKKLENLYTLAKDIGVSGFSLLIIPASTFALGTWQIQRQKWKTDLIEKLNNRINQEPIELPENLEELQSMEYCPVKVRGTFLYEKQFLAGFRSLIKDGKSSESGSIMADKTKTGYHVITPFKLADRDLTILVNRGWIPRSQKNSVKKQKVQSDEEVEVIGIVRVNETRPQFVPKNSPQRDMWHYRDVNEMAKLTDSDPIYIEMVHNKNAPLYPIGGQTKVELRNEHLSYIITWYSLSAITAYMWYKRFILYNI